MGGQGLQERLARRGGRSREREDGAGSARRVGTRGSAVERRPLANRACGGTFSRCNSGSGVQLQRKVAGFDPVEGSGLEPGSYAERLVRSVLNSPGEPLDEGTRAHFEHRFGVDFSAVRVHRDMKAARSAWVVAADAYTVGAHIAFGRERYLPGTEHGRALIAHELAHVVQQGRRPNGAGNGNLRLLDDPAAERAAAITARSDSAARSLAPAFALGCGPCIIQRAETDTSAGCDDLEDCESDVNDRINRALTEARAASGSNASGVIEGLANELAVNSSLGRTGIEDWAAGLGNRKVRQLAQTATKYADVSFGLWNPVFPILNPTMRIHDICVGSDKLGHFLQQGYQYFRLAQESGYTVADAERLGEAQEAGEFGLMTTGVYSNADLEANRQGLRFYNDLAATPSLTFTIAAYINPRWNEETNPSHYEASVGRTVWRNLVSGNWQGEFTSAVDTSPQWITVDFTVAPDGYSVSGQFGYTSPRGDVVNGSITAGRITHLTNSRGAVSGIEIAFSWSTSMSMFGRGRWTSQGESRLEGSWGYGAAETGGGDWDLDRSRTPQAIPVGEPPLRYQFFVRGSTYSASEIQAGLRQLNNSQEAASHSNEVPMLKVGAVEVVRAWMEFLSDQLQGRLRALESLVFALWFDSGAPRVLRDFAYEVSMEEATMRYQPDADRPHYDQENDEVVVNRYSFESVARLVSDVLHEATHRAFRETNLPIEDRLLLSGYEIGQRQLALHCLDEMIAVMAEVEASGATGLAQQSDSLVAAWNYYYLHWAQLPSELKELHLDYDEVLNRVSDITGLSREQLLSVAQEYVRDHLQSSTFL